MDPAGASFHGANGAIAFSVQGNYRCISGGLSAAIYEFSPGPTTATIRYQTPMLRFAGDPAWTAGGHTLAAARYTPIYGHSGMGFDARGIFTTSAHGAHRRTVTHFGSTPSWARDRRAIAFAGGQRGLYVVSVRDRHARRIDRHPPLDLDWSSRGRIAYTDYLNRIWTIDATGRHRRLLAHGEEPNWSPDGGEVVFRATSGALELIRSNGSGLRVVRAATDGFNPVWSPDGAQVAFTLNGPSDPDGGVYAIRADGSGERQLAQLTADPCGDTAIVTGIAWQSLVLY